MPSQDMDSELAYYVVTHYHELMTSAERAAERHLATTYKATGGRSDASAQAEVRAEGGPRRRWLSDDPEVLALAADGLEAFRLKAAARILATHRDEIFLNRCPKCGGLTRTPRAKLCLHCGHAWHHAAAG
jgi:hypothetical protein